VKGELKVLTTSIPDPCSLAVSARGPRREAARIARTLRRCARSAYSWYFADELL
jgi:hypothetical protein